MRSATATGTALIVTVFSMAVVISAHAGVWDSTYEGIAGVHENIDTTTDISQSPSHQRNQRQQVRKRLDVGHHVGDADGTSDDNGLHRLGSARCFMQDDPPDELNDSHSSASAINDYDNTEATSGVSDLEDSASTSAGGIEDDVGHGRCWIDTDDGYEPYVYVGTAGDNTPSNATDGWLPIAYKGSNLLLHGDFETADGDGDGDSTSTTIPSNWTLVGTNTFAYTTSVQGDGKAVVSTAGAATSGLEATLNGLRASTWYIVRADVNASGVGDFRLKISDAARTYPSGGSVDNVSSAAWETVWIAALTDATAPESIDVELLGVANTDECDWDNVRAYRAGGGDRPQVQLFEATDSTSGSQSCTTDYTTGCTDVLEVVIDPSEGQYLVQFTVKVNVDIATEAERCRVELHDGTQQLVEWKTHSADTLQLSLGGTHAVMLTSGTSTTYSVSVEGTSTGCDYEASAGNVNTLQAVLVPAGG